MSRRAARRAVPGVLVALAATAALTIASRLPVAANGSDDAMLRLAWTARPERVERCRTLGDDELSALPAHMRQQVVCEGTTAQYRVDVSRNGELLATDHLRGGGLRHDRQLYHYRELRVPSGQSALEVRVTRIGPQGDASSRSGQTQGGAGRGSAVVPTGEVAARDDLGRSRRRGDEIPPALVLTETVTLAPREVMLVTYDRTARRLRFERRD